MKTLNEKDLAHLAHLARQNEIARALSARAVKNLRKRVIAELSQSGVTSLHVEWGDGERSSLSKSPLGRLLMAYRRINKLSTLGVEECSNIDQPVRKARLVGVVRGNAENYANHYYLIAP